MTPLERASGSTGGAPTEISTLPPVPGHASLTVVMLPDEGAAQADACLAKIDYGQQWVVGPSEMFLHHLRLRCEQDPTLLPKIAVWFLNREREYGRIGLTFEEESRWPIGFAQEAWENEVEIGKLRDSKRKSAASRVPSESPAEVRAAVREALTKLALETLAAPWYGMINRTNIEAWRDHEYPLSSESPDTEQKP